MHVLLRVAAFVFISTQVCCGRGPAIDLDRAVVLSDGAPKITDLRFVQQSSMSRDVLIFEADYERGQSDLANGFIDVFMNAKEKGPRGRLLRPIFLQNELDPSSAIGTLRFSVELSFEQTDWKRTGAIFEIAFQLRDPSGLVSNKPKVRFFAEIPSEM